MAKKSAPPPKKTKRPPPSDGVKKTKPAAAPASALLIGGSRPAITKPKAHKAQYLRDRHDHRIAICYRFAIHSADIGGFQESLHCLLRHIYAAGCPHVFFLV